MTKNIIILNKPHGLSRMLTKKWPIKTAPSEKDWFKKHGSWALKMGIVKI